MTTKTLIEKLEIVRLFVLSHPMHKHAASTLSALNDIKVAIIGQREAAPQDVAMGASGLCATPESNHDSGSRGSLPNKANKANPEASASETLNQEALKLSAERLHRYIFPGACEAVAEEVISAFLNATPRGESEAKAVGRVLEKHLSHASQGEIPLPDEETLRAMVASEIHHNGGTYSIMDATAAIRALRPYLRESKREAQPLEIPVLDEEELRAKLRAVMTDCTSHSFHKADKALEVIRPYLKRESVAVDKSADNPGLVAERPMTAWKPIETAPTKEDEAFLVRLPGNDVCKTLAVQVSIFEGYMYPDCKDGLIDWDDAIVGADAWLPLPKPQ